MEEACKRTGIHRDIMEIDQQYRTVLEESGRNLSSGQKQKLGLARLFLRKNVSLYLLDEIDVYKRQSYMWKNIQAGRLEYTVWQE